MYTTLIDGEEAVITWDGTGRYSSPKDGNSWTKEKDFNATDVTRKYRNFQQKPATLDSIRNRNPVE